MKVLVMIEHREGVVSEASLEAIGAARQVGDSVVAILPSGRSAIPDMCGADELLVVENEVLNDYNYGLYRDTLIHYMNELHPDAVMGAHTSVGMDLYPGVAAKAGIPYLPDCTSISVEGGKIKGVRQIYGGKIEAEYAANPPCIISTRPGVFKQVSSKAQVREEKIQLGQASGALHTGFRMPPKEDVDIERARVVVAVGRGIEKQENLKMVEELVSCLDGAVLAGSRPIIDSGWLPKGRQVGVSGKVVKPKLYLALGISGAIQHLSGMSESELIVAVNRDREAPIFKVAHIGIVDDIFKFVPALTQELRKG